MEKAFTFALHGDIANLLTKADESLRAAQSVASDASNMYIIRWVEGALSSDGKPDMGAIIHSFDVASLSRGMRQSIDELKDTIDAVAVSTWRERTGTAYPARPSWRVGVTQRFKKVSIGFLEESIAT